MIGKTVEFVVSMSESYIYIIRNVDCIGYFITSKTGKMNEASLKEK